MKPQVSPLTCGFVFFQTALARSQFETGLPATNPGTHYGHSPPARHGRARVVEPGPETIYGAGVSPVQPPVRRRTHALRPGR